MQSLYQQKTHMFVDLFQLPQATVEMSNLIVKTPVTMILQLRKEKDLFVKILLTKMLKIVVILVLLFLLKL